MWNMTLVYRNHRKKLISFLALILLGTWIFYEHYKFYSFPSTRLELNEEYVEMPSDENHHYLELPVDHFSSDSKFYKGFYILSPNFNKEDDIVFLLTDGQMELVTPNSTLDFFETILGKSSYVIIGRRGHSPTLFPEIFNSDGTVNYEAAINLYNSEQHIEDIDMIRLDLIKKNLLGRNDKIMLFGASGAGVLAQQYISKYGNNVSRVILESTGAPDLSKNNNVPFSHNFKDYNLEGEILLDAVTKSEHFDKPTISNILYQTARANEAPIASQIKILQSLKNGGSLFAYKFKPKFNMTFMNYMIKSPSAVAARVRWFELVGSDLINYKVDSETNLLYEFSKIFLSDFLEYYISRKIKPKEFKLNRNDFLGELFILKGKEDVVFSDSINLKIKQAYPNSKIAFFNYLHKYMKNIKYYKDLRLEFFKNGFKSSQFENLLKTPRILIKF